MSSRRFASGIWEGRISATSDGQWADGLFVVEKTVCRDCSDPPPIQGIAATYRFLGAPRVLLHATIDYYIWTHACAMIEEGR